MTRLVRALTKIPIQRQGSRCAKQGSNPPHWSLLLLASLLASSHQQPLKGASGLVPFGVALRSASWLFAA